MTLTLFVHAASHGGPPLTPGASEARELLQQELAKQAYQSAKPTPFDLAARAVLDWLASLFTVQGSGAPTVLAIVGLVVVVVLAVVALLLFGRPKANVRSRAGALPLFGELDVRTAAEMRSAARAAAAQQDFTLAVLEGFRGLARGLEERTIVQMFPGTTAAGFAREASSAFAEHASALRASANAFDRLRYGNQVGTAAEWQLIVDLEAALERARPALALVSAE